MLGIFARVSVAVINSMDQKQPREEGVHFTSQFHITVRHGGTSGQEFKQVKDLEAGAHSQATEGCCLLACFLGLARLAF